MTGRCLGARRPEGYRHHLRTSCFHSVRASPSASPYTCAALRGGHGDVTWGSQRGIIAIVWKPITGAAFHQLVAAQHDKQSDRHHEVNGEAGQEDDDLIERQTGALDNLGRDATRRC